VPPVSTSTIPASSRSVAPPGAPGARVPSQFIGLARQLRQRIGAEQQGVDAAVERLIRPLRPKPGFTPMARHAFLRRIAAEWGALPSAGRLGLVAEFSADDGLRIADLRCRSVRMQLPGWADGGDELGIAVTLTLVGCRPPLFVHEHRLLVDVGLHALGRRYQRASREDAAVLADLRVLAEAHPSAVLSEDREFVIVASGGRWRGSITRVKSDGVMCARTFVA